MKSSSKLNRSFYSLLDSVTLMDTLITNKRTFYITFSAKSICIYNILKYLTMYQILCLFLVYEPEDHKLAGQRLKTFYDDSFSNVYTKLNAEYLFSPDFIQDHKLTYNKHSYDFLARTLHFWLFVEIDQRSDTTVTLENGRKLKISKSKHDKQHQTMNDQIAEDYIINHVCKMVKSTTIFVRIQKEDCFDYYRLNKIFMYIKMDLATKIPEKRYQGYSYNFVKDIHL